MPPRNDLEALFAEAGIRPAALDPRNTARREAPRPLPRSMRPPEQRMRDTRLGQAERLRAAGQATFGPDITLDGPNFGDQGRMDYVRQLRRDPGGAAVGALGDVTGVRPLATGVGQLAQGDVREGIINTGLGALTLGTLGAGRPALRGAPIRGRPLPYREPQPWLPPRAGDANDNWLVQRNSQMDELETRQRVIDGSIGDGTPSNYVTMDQLIRVGRDPRTAPALPRALDDYLGEYSADRSMGTTPLLGSPDIAADPLANAPRAGLTPRPQGPPTIAREDRYLFGAPPPAVPTPPPTLSPTWERAGDGSVLPVRPQSDRLFSRTAPTSADLRGAAAVPPAFGGQVPLSPIDVFHGTPRRGKDSFFPWSHHGTQRAARDRLRETGTRGLFRRRGDLLQTQIAPGRVIDLPDDADGRSVFVSPHATIAEIARLGHFTQEEMEYIWEPLIVARANREPGVALTFEGYSATDAMEKRAAEVLQRKGIVAFRYRNEYEDPGSYSYVVPDPRNARVGRGEWPSGPEAPPAITAPQAQPPISPSLGDLPAPRPRGNAPDPGGVFVDRVTANDMGPINRLLRSSDERDDYFAPTGFNGRPTYNNLPQNRARLPEVMSNGAYPPSFRTLANQPFDDDTMAALARQIRPSPYDAALERQLARQRLRGPQASELDDWQGAYFEQYGRYAETPEELDEFVNLLRRARGQIMETPPP